MITAPGAPLAGPPRRRTPPRPSPNHHTPRAHVIEAPSASLRVGRQAIPRPIASWMNAKIAFVAVGWSAMSLADQLIGSAMTAGLPAAVPPSICEKPLLNMKAWNCSTASSSQMPASANCSRRLTSGAVQPSSCTAPTPRAVGRGLASAAGSPCVSFLHRAEVRPSLRQPEFAACGAGNGMRLISSCWIAQACNGMT